MHPSKNIPVFTRLYLIRHGQTEWNKKELIQGSLDIPLNAEGIVQANALAAMMVGQFPVDLIYSSPAQRALETAKIINNEYNTEILVESSLIEVDFGALTNHTITDLERVHPDYIQQFNHFILTNRDHGTPRPELPDGEPIEEIERRVQSFIEQLLTQHSGKKIAIISHGSFLKCMMTFFSGESLKNYMPYRIENASLSIVDFYGRLPVIRKLNDTGHLKQPLEFAVPRIL